MNLSGLLLKLAGWHVDVEVDMDSFPKCIICVAPHTSNWDFIIGKLACASRGIKISFLMKSDWFFFPLGPIFKAIGGIPVVRGKKKKEYSLVDAIVAKFAQEPKLRLVITPEGTRSRTNKWRTGFLHIANQAQVPCLLATLDYSTKRVAIDKAFFPTADIDADLAAIKKFYTPFKGKYPEKFSTDSQ